MQYTIVMNDEELKKCLAIRKEVFVEEQNVDISEEIDEYDQIPSSATHFLLTNNDQAIGTSRMKPYEGSAVKLQRIAVRKDARGIGAGKMLVQAMEQAAAAQGYDTAVLDAQCHAEDFYRKLGYVPVSDEIFLDAGIPHIQMSHKL